MLKQPTLALHNMRFSFDAKTKTFIRHHRHRFVGNENAVYVVNLLIIPNTLLHANSISDNISSYDFASEIAQTFTFYAKDLIKFRNNLDTKKTIEYII